MVRRTGAWWRALLLGLTLVLGLPSGGPSGSQPPATLAATPPADGRLFVETGQRVSADFLATWQAGGGLPIFGLPLTPEQTELDEASGQPMTVQWFERARFERTPAPAGQTAPVTLGLLGRQSLAGRALAPARGGPLADGRYFPETGQTVAGLFREAWERQGGLAIFGYPLTGEMRETGSDGRAPTVQYFERARFEDHGSEAEPRVRLGLIGQELLAQPIQVRWEAEEALAHSFTSAFVYAGSVLGHDQALYVESDQPPPNSDRYRARYGLRLPRPTTYHLWAHLYDLSAGSALQWRFADQPWQVADARLPATTPVLIRAPHRYAWYRLGSLTLGAGWHRFEIEVVPGAGGSAIAGLDAFVLTNAAGAPAAGSGRPAQALGSVVRLQSDLGAAGQPWARLHRGLAQGGEEIDPAYLQRVAPQLRALGTRYIRLDHIFDYYDVLQRDRRRFTYDFSRLDAALDAVLASGAQPFISLGLTPRLLAPSGNENEPPVNRRAWQELVTATVEHVNGTRGLGVRYWEVWNEPNLPPFWAGSFGDYAELYRLTAEAVSAGDPTALVGGPATAGHEFWLEALIDYVADRNVRLDFISWHTYHIRPTMLRNQVDHVRRSLARHPQLQGIELIVSEWNLHSDYGARTNFVSDSHVAATYLVAMLQAMIDSGLHQALFFEAVDGRPPPGQVSWGRWGSLTYDGRPKPVYHALDALQRLHDLRQPASSDDPRVGLLLTRQERQLALVVWYLANEGQGPQPVQLTLERPPGPLTSLRRWTIDGEHSRLGGTLEEVAPLSVRSEADGRWTVTFTVAPNSVTLLTGGD